MAWRRIRQVLVAAGLAVALVVGAAADFCAASAAVPILVYHRFGPTATDAMTTPVAVFTAQLALLQERGYTAIPLRQLVDSLHGQGPSPPERAVVLTVDDGHRSVYTELFPIARQHRLPVTLFIYPSAISNAAYALTWSQLRELRDSGLFEIQSHTFWHPNFARERQRLPADEYQALVTMQLVRSRQTLEKELGTSVDLLAWPFGIHNRELQQRAAEAGYVAAFTIVPRPASGNDEPMAIPRFLLTATTGVRGIAEILAQSAARR